MKPMRFHPDADTEMVEAAAWYEIQQEHLSSEQVQIMLRLT
jgi:hypothetical protein